MRIKLHIEHERWWFIGGKWHLGVPRRSRIEAGVIARPCGSDFFDSEARRSIWLGPASWSNSKERPVENVCAKCLDYAQGKDDVG